MQHLRIKPGVTGCCRYTLVMPTILTLVSMQTTTTTPTAPDAVVDAAPWWGVPLVAGLFVLFGALIALLSAFLSDRRKLRREDQRQWDREIRDLYVAAMRETAVIRDGWRSLRQKSALERQDMETCWEAQDRLRDIGRSMEIIGAPATITALDELQEAVHGVVSNMHDLVFDKEEYRKIRPAEDAFLKAVKRNLRVDEHRPRPFYLK
jgi:hypothetical protein